jgi:arabinoxylan arabinofuranohydrolase
MKTNFNLVVVLSAAVCFMHTIKTTAQTTPLGIYKIDENIKYPYKFKYKENPLVAFRSSTDPDVQVWDGVLWMYCSQDHPKTSPEKGSYDAMDGYHVFSTKDMKNWVDHGEVMSSKDVGWGKQGWMWAPGSARKNGKYYLYYPHLDVDGIWKTGVAIGDSPAGPFKDTGKPIEGITGIDPKVLVDDDGEAYIYNNHAIVAKLKPNMIELAEKPREIVYGPEAVMKDSLQNFINRTGECSYMHKKDGKYYYSFTNFKNKSYQGYYAIGDSPYGPFEWKGAMAPKPQEAQDHHSIIEFKGKWYYFYHINTPTAVRKEMNWNGPRRIACFDRLYYNADGTIKMVEHILPESISSMKKQ